MDPPAVVDAGLQIEAVPRRNSNFVVRIGDGEGFFLKQANGLSLGAEESVAREGWFYASNGSSPGIAGLLPRLVLYDAENGILVLRLLIGHVTLRHHCSTLEQLRFPTHLWGALGRRISRIQGMPPGDASPLVSPGGLLFPDSDFIADVSPPALQVLEVMQSSGIRQGLAIASDEWNPTVFAHGDLRVDNILIDELGPHASIKMVDWEMCGLADPMWDLAASFEAAITMALARFADHALWLPVVQSAARGSWREYHAARQLDVPYGRAATAKVASFAAWRLASTALELSEHAGTMTNAAVTCLQIAENILADPGLAAADLFALRRS